MQNEIWDEDNITEYNADSTAVWLWTKNHLSIIMIGQIKYSLTLWNIPAPIQSRTPDWKCQDVSP